MPWKNKGNGQVYLSGQVHEWVKTIDHFFKEDQTTHSNLNKSAYYLITAFLLSKMARNTLSGKKLEKVEAMWVEGLNPQLVQGKTLYDVLDYLADETDQMFLFHWLTEARSVIVQTALQNS